MNQQQHCCAGNVRCSGAVLQKHETTTHQFGQYFVVTGHVEARFHTYLNEANIARNFADYGIVDAPLPETALEHYNHAQAFYAMGKAWLDNQPDESNQ